MTLTLELITGSDLTLDRESLTISRKFRVRGTLPYTGGGDAFDSVSSQVMAAIRSSYPTYGTDMGTLFWNSIQLHENYYATDYGATVVYSPFDKQSGTYQIQIDQAVGNVHVTAGTRIAGYPTTTCPDCGGLFFNGEEVTGCEVPVEEDKIIIAYRHPKAWLNPSYIRNIGALRGYPCADTFLGYAIGEVRYMGGSFVQTDAEASASYTFEISRNATDLVVAGITISTKSGFDVLSPHYEDGTGTAGGVNYPKKTVTAIEVIRPRALKAYKPIFGWG